jgi:HEAT repeat protein
VEDNDTSRDTRGCGEDRPADVMSAGRARQESLGRRTMAGPLARHRLFLPAILIVSLWVLTGSSVAHPGKPLDVLTAELRNPEASVRLSAALELGRNKATEAVPQLVSTLGDEDFDVGDAAERALIAIGTPAVEPLISVLTTGGRDAKIHAASALGKLRDPRAVEPLIAVLRDPEDTEHWDNAALALGEIGDPRAVEPLVKMLATSNRSLRPFAIEGLSKISDPRVPEALTKAAVADPDDFVRQTATKALQNMAYQPSSLHDRVVLLLTAGRSDSIAALGPEAQPILLTILKDGATSLRAAAASALAKFPAPPAVEYLIGALTDSSPKVRENAAETLGMIRDPLRVKPLISRLKDPDTFVRMQSRAALSNFANPEVGAAVADADAFWAPAQTKADVLRQRGAAPYSGHTRTARGSLETWVYRERCGPTAFGDRGGFYYIYFDSAGKVEGTRCDRSLTIESH